MELDSLLLWSFRSYLNHVLSVACWLAGGHCLGCASGRHSGGSYDYCCCGAAETGCGGLDWVGEGPGCGNMYVVLITGVDG